MNNFGREVHNIWHPDVFEIFQLAIRQKSAVSIQSHLPLDECNTADVLLDGRIIDISGHTAQFVVEDFDLAFGNAYPPAPACDYALTVDMPMGNSIVKMEYGGKAVILDRVLQKNSLPAGLLLRISMPSRIRQSRRHERQSSVENVALMPGLLLIDREPVSRKGLLALLSHYYRQKNRPRPEIVNISAGGVCLQTNDRRGRGFMAAEEYFLFFYFSSSMGKPEGPNVFIGKKVGIFRQPDNGQMALRIRFLKEMKWRDPAEELRWIDIEGGGSPSIRKMLSAMSKKQSRIEMERPEDKSPISAAGKNQA